ncbi:MAG: hypothetical protein HQ553_12590 [Chloroflexi bacterium]|nr:hypothetical protein [Chloroflexota bacterium]
MIQSTINEIRDKDSIFRLKKWRKTTLVTILVSGTCHFLSFIGLAIYAVFFDSCDGSYECGWSLFAALAAIFLAFLSIILFATIAGIFRKWPILGALLCYVTAILLSYLSVIWMQEDTFPLFLPAAVLFVVIGIMNTQTAKIKLDLNRSY